MTKIAVALLLTVFANQVLADIAASESAIVIQCEAEYREVLEDGSVLNEKVIMPVVLDTPTNVMIEGMLADFAFSLVGDKRVGFYMLTIAGGVDFTHASSSRAQFDNNGELSLNFVHGRKLHRLFCTKQFAESGN